MKKLLLLVLIPLLMVSACTINNDSSNNENNGNSQSNSDVNLENSVWSLEQTGGVDKYIISLQFRNNHDVFQVEEEDFISSGYGPYGPGYIRKKFEWMKFYQKGNKVLVWTLEDGYGDCIAYPGDDTVKDYDFNSIGPNNYYGALWVGEILSSSQMRVFASYNYDDPSKYATLENKPSLMAEMNSLSIEYPARVEPYYWDNSQEGQGITTNYSETVLAAPVGTTVHMVGNIIIGNNRTTWQPFESNLMTPTSLKAVSELDESVAQKLATKSLDWLYMIDVTFDGGFNQPYNYAYYVKDGELHQVDASYAFKAVTAEYDEQDEVYVTTQWITYPANVYPYEANAEALTDNIYMPPYQKELDDYGRSWEDSPCLNTGEPGTYTVIVAKYKVQSSLTTVGYGFALIEKA